MILVKDVVVFPSTHTALVLPNFEALNSPNRPSLIAIFGLRSPDESFEIGTLARLVSTTNLKDRTEVRANHKTGYQMVLSKIQAVVEGLEVVKVRTYTEKKEGLQYAEVEIIAMLQDLEADQSFRDTLRRYLEVCPMDSQIKKNTLKEIENETSLSVLCSKAAHILQISFKAKQELLQMNDIKAKANAIEEYLSNDAYTVGTDEDAANSNSWTKYRKVSVDSSSVNSTENYMGSLDNLGLDPEVDEYIRREIWNLEQQQPNSPEHFRSVNYIETVLKLPWNVEVPENTDVYLAERRLDEDLVGMPLIKRRLLEHIAVKSLTANTRGAVLCINGPPGIGKTSIAESVAKAMGRPFGKISLGGVEDEATIRGNRRTYHGAMPGNLISLLLKLKCKNPVILLDEIDKLGHNSTYNAVSAALLEVLDVSMNSAFCDHWLGVPFDLSKVLFISTCNSAESIPAALLDRMDITSLPGYNLTEKLQIAESSLIPKALENAGLPIEALQISHLTVREIIEEYTAEAGVRELQRKLNQICRYVAYETLTSTLALPYRVQPQHLEDILGVSSSDNPPVIYCKL